MTDKLIKVFIVDDHQLFIDGLKAILKSFKDMKVVGEALNGEDCLQQLKQKSVDVLVTDISMPIMSGNELAYQVKRNYPDIKVLALSMHNNIESIDAMMKAGASGYILKNTGRKELKEAIFEIYKGGNYYGPLVKEAMVNNYVSPVKNMVKKPAKEKRFFLTSREKEVVSLIIHGMSNTEIAEELMLSIHTIIAHRKNIYSKMNVSNTASLIETINENNVQL